jgi:hypothetical protein
LDFHPDWINENGKIALSTNLAIAFTNDKRPGGLNMSRETPDGRLNRDLDVEDRDFDAERIWDRERSRLLNEHMKRKVGSYSLSDSDICEFYNVLWVERRGKIAYRRACGWVPKHVWEANTSGPVEVKLG